MKIAVISDIHANAVALDAVYNSEPFQKADKVIVCGDLIGYYYWPDQVLQTIQSDDRFICIRGNHEDNLKKAIDLEDLDDEKKVTYQIVGDDEAEIKSSKISISSPIARALIGKELGDVVEVETPGGIKSYEIMNVKYI